MFPLLITHMRSQLGGLGNVQMVIWREQIAHQKETNWKPWKTLREGVEMKLISFFFLTMIEPRHTRDGSEGKQKHSSSWENGECKNSWIIPTTSKWSTARVEGLASSSIEHIDDPRYLLALCYAENIPWTDHKNLCFYLIFSLCLRRALA